MTALHNATGATVEPGTIYEDCAFHPVLCTEVHDDRSVSGISLIDGSSPRNCSIDHCDVVVLTLEDVMEIRGNFTKYVERRQRELTPDTYAD